MLGTRYLKLGQIICLSFFLITSLRTEVSEKAQINRAKTEFAMNILKEIYANDAKSNLNFSPHSLYLSFSLTANGASGVTRTEMLKILGHQNIEIDDVNHSIKTLQAQLNKPMAETDLNIAQSIWIDHNLKLKEDFLEINKSSYLTDLKSLDLRDPLAPDHINSWVFKNTDEKIFSMVDDIDPDVIMYLLSTVYFKGEWAVQFKEENSRIQKFVSNDRTAKELIFMKTKSEEISFLEGKGFKAAGLPYGEGDISMYFFLPDETSHLDLFLHNLNTDNWEKWMKDFRTQEVVVEIPKVKLDSDIKFNNILQEMGLKSAFSGQADFSNMTDGKAFISEVKQKSFIEFTEKGTEAAAADMVVFKKGGCEQISFNRPFFYSLVDNRTGTILMMGVYQN